MWQLPSWTMWCNIKRTYQKLCPLYTQCWEWASISMLLIYIGHFDNCNLSRLTFHVHQFGNFYPFFWLRKKSEITEKLSKHIKTEILNEFKFKNYILLIIFVIISNAPKNQFTGWNLEGQRFVGVKRKQWSKQSEQYSFFSRLFINNLRLRQLNFILVIQQLPASFAGHFSWNQETVYMQGYKMYKLNGCKLGYTCTWTSQIGHLPKPQNSTILDWHEIGPALLLCLCFCELFPKLNYSMNPLLEASKCKNTIYNYIFFLQNFIFIS